MCLKWPGFLDSEVDTNHCCQADNFGVLHVLLAVFMFEHSRTVSTLSRAVNQELYVGYRRLNLLTDGIA